MTSRHFNLCSLLSCFINSTIGRYVKAQRNLIHVLHLSMFMQIPLAHFNEEVREGHHHLFRILWHLLWNAGSSAKRQLLSLHEPVTLTSASAEVFLTQVFCHPRCYCANHVFWHGDQWWSVHSETISSRLSRKHFLPRWAYFCLNTASCLVLSSMMWNCCPARHIALCSAKCKMWIFCVAEEFFLEMFATLRYARQGF